MFALRGEHMFVKLLIVCLLAAAGVAPWPGRRRARPARHYVVKPGDTLWSIAVAHGTRAIPREAVWKLQQRNDVDAAAAAGRRHRPAVAGRSGGAGVAR